MRAIVSLLILFITPFLGYADVLELGKGRVVDVSISQPQAGKPVFMMLPGVNRGLFLEEPAAKALKKLGFGVVSFNFSLQPASIGQLPDGVEAYFRRQDVTLDDLAKESEAVAKAAAKKLGVTQVIPVTLSYSGSLSTRLTTFANIIDTVPLTSMAAFSPQLEAYRQWLKAGEIINPIFGPGLTRQWLDAAYRFQWENQVNSLSSQPGFNTARKGDMVEGYVRMSRATEGYEWDDKGHARHDFILAKGEGASLQLHQIEVVTARLKQGLPERVFVVEKSGHIIPADQPEAYARILEKIVSSRPNRGQVIVVNPASDKWVEMDAENGVDYLKKLSSGTAEPRPIDEPGFPPKKPIPGTF